MPLTWYVPTPSVGHVTGEIKRSDSLTVNIKTKDISETRILACFVKICSRENHLLYDSYVQTKMILESFLSLVLPIVTYLHRWSIHQLDITITLVCIVLASGYLFSPAYSKGTRAFAALNGTSTHCHTYRKYTGSLWSRDPFQDTLDGSNSVHIIEVPLHIYIRLDIYTISTIILVLIMWNV